MELLERRLCLSEKKIGGTLTTVACASGGGRYIRASPRCARVSYSPPACSLGCRMRRCTSRTFTHTHTWGGFSSSIARQPRECHVPNDVRLRKALGDMFPAPYLLFLATTALFQPWRCRAWKNRPRGVWYTSPLCAVTPHSGDSARVALCGRWCFTRLGLHSCFGDISLGIRGRFVLMYTAPP